MEKQNDKNTPPIRSTEKQKPMSSNPAARTTSDSSVVIETYPNNYYGEARDFFSSILGMAFK
ncbi:17443_t:CDS:2, partial [Racocetra fulgida]